jgi:glycosyltransferase involved in cell wall biosynthesis
MQVTRFVEGGSAVVVDNIARGLDKNRYEPLVLFETNVNSNIRKKLSESEIKTIDLKKCTDDRCLNLNHFNKNMGIGRRIQAKFGKKTHQIYLSLNSFSRFLSTQAPRVRSFIRAYRENEVDLIHTHSDLTLGKPEIIAAHIYGIPCVSHLHTYPYLNHFNRMFSRFVDAFIYISSDVAKFHTCQGIAKTKGKIIHNGVDIRKFNRNYGSDSVHKEFGIKPYQTLIGLIGRIDWWKGHEYFLKAMAIALKHNADLKGLIVGDLEKRFSVNRNKLYLEKLKSLVNSLDLKDKIIFTGFRNDIPRIISALNLVVHASTKPEPFGMVVIEAMAAGKPVVATAAGGVLDIIQDGINGLLVPRMNSDAMAKAILYITLNPDKATEIGIASRQRVCEKFVVEKQIMKLQEFYDDIFANHQHRHKRNRTIQFSKNLWTNPRPRSDIF